MDNRLELTDQERKALEQPEKSGVAGDCAGAPKAILLSGRRQTPAEIVEFPGPCKENIEQWRRNWWDHAWPAARRLAYHSPKPLC